VLRSFTLLCLLFLALPVGRARADRVLTETGAAGRFELTAGRSPIASGHGWVEIDPADGCLTPELRTEIVRQSRENAARLQAEGRLAPPVRGTLANLIRPVEGTARMVDEGFHAMMFFVDHDSVIGSRQDYECGIRTYDETFGYNHQGSDFVLWPFPWHKMLNTEVRIVAAAPGTIVWKNDGVFDQSCDLPDVLWNGVTVQHADGSLALYGHMKSGSLTWRPVGSQVTAGMRLGNVGSSGRSFVPHLHFELLDVNDNVMDPYTGACNSDPSLWASQPPYYDSAINAVMTHSAPPVYPPCPQEEILNEETEFPGSNAIVYVSAHYRDQLDTQLSQYRVYDPDGQVAVSWNHSSPMYYDRSWWWWSIDLGASPKQGVWRFEVTYEGTITEQPFGVGVANGADELAGSGLALHGAFPNPAASATTIRFDLPQAGLVNLSIFDPAGRHVRTVLSSRRPAGPGSALWDGRDDHGRPVGSGVYFYRLVSGPFSETRKMARVR